jgi:predicted alpha-1,2-mannosidase
MFCSPQQFLRATCLLLFLSVQIFAQRDFTRYVDPFIGTGGHGHTFPGAIVPFGMVQLSPDTRLTGWDGCSGYHYSDSVIYGFSHTHLSGTGISDYGDILLMPTSGEVRFNASGDRPELGYASRFDHRNETARTGYYSVKLEDDNIFVELTATARVGFHRYTFPRTVSAGNILVDLTHRDKVVDSGLKITGDRTLVGWRRSTGWAKDQIVFFAAEFSRPFKSYGIAINDQLAGGVREAGGRNIKAFFSFEVGDEMPVLAKLAISATSIEGALKNLSAEVPGWNFDAIKNDATSKWNAELSKITVTGGTDAQLKNFYTALYHSMTAPNLFMDVDGKYLGLDRQIHTATGFSNYTVFSLWDTFRAAHPLYTIIDQKRTGDFVKTFLAQYEEGGRLPVWELAANETDTMIGYHSVSVIADALAKGIRGYDVEKAFAAMKHSAELKHFGLAAYIDHGYIGSEEERESVSKTLEYAYDDWCIAQVALLLGKRADYERYLARAQYYKNVFDVRTGFVRPRTNGNWLTPFEPREVNFSFTEANSWQYTFFAPQDVSGLIELMGGRLAFGTKLDQLFLEDSPTTGREQADITGLIGQYAHGNEPSHHMAYLYDYVGEQWKTAARVRDILERFYQPTPDGLIGNEDCGQMSAWYVLSAAGFYPVTPGSPVYAIGTTLFPEVRFNLENGKTFVIKAQGVSEKNIYIQSARLNGRPYRKSYLTHRDLMAGGELIFVMGPRPNRSWGTGKGNEPESRIEAPSIVPAPIISARGQTFKDQMSVELRDNVYGASSLTIHYTTDGSEPTLKSPQFSTPVTINETATLKARSIDREGRAGSVVTAKFHRIPHEWSLQLFSRYSSQYTAGGDFALIDGIRGTTNWSGGGWQGYQGRDFVAVIDLGSVQAVSKFGAGFLQDVGSWIWLPRRVEFEVSLDGKNFTPVVSVPNEIPDGRTNGAGTGVVMKDFVGSATTQARYVRVRAANYGRIPEWHPGSGGASWIFIDEIFVE